jgi:hypothetical protein
MRLTEQSTLNFNKICLRPLCFWISKKAFDITWHSGLLYKLSKLEFLTSLIQFISSFLSQCKLRVSVEAKCLRQGKCEQGYLKVLSCPLLCTDCYSRLNTLYSPGTDRTENAVPLLQSHCCLAMSWRIPLLLAQPSVRTARKTPFVFYLRAAE